MKKVLVFFLSLLIFVSCNSDDENSTSDATLIGNRYVYSVLDCENEDPIANSCFASIEFFDSQEVGILPFGDAIYSVGYVTEDKTVRVLFSEFFVDGVDQFFIIESEDVLIEQESGSRYLRQ